MDDATLRHRIYRTLADTGAAPTRADLEAWAGVGDAAGAALQRLHDAHAIVLDDSGAIRMALPFSAVPTGYRVAGAGGRWWANCAWDSLAIPAALSIDARIEAAWWDTGEPVDLTVNGDRVLGESGFVHFLIPAKHWWDDIVET